MLTQLSDVIRQPIGNLLRMPWGDTQVAGLEQDQKVKLSLTSPTAITVSVAADAARLKACKGVWLASKFKDMFPAAGTPVVGKKFGLQWRDFAGCFNDVDLIRELGGEDVSVFDSIEELDSVISTMIAQQVILRQDCVESGDLVSRAESANITFVRHPALPSKIMYVNVCCDSRNREWRVFTSELGDHQLDIDFRVFVPIST